MALSANLQPCCCLATILLTAFSPVILVHPLSAALGLRVGPGRIWKDSSYSAVDKELVKRRVHLWEKSLFFRKTACLSFARKEALSNETWSRAALAETLD